MHALLGAFGTRGDLQPMLALAIGLRAAGHEVTICGPPNFRDWMTARGLRYHSFGVDSEAFLTKVGLNVLHAAKLLPQQVRDQFDGMLEPTRGADIFICAGMNAAGQSIAEKWGIPYQFIAYSAQMLPSREHPSIALPWHRMPKWLNALTWKMNDFVWNTVFRKAANAERARLGLRPVQSAWASALGEHVIVASDPMLGAIPPDVTLATTQVGAFALPEPEEIDPELEAFLSAGPPPVYIGFGSMPDKKPERTSRILVEAIEAAGVRALLSKGWAQLGGRALPPTVRLIGATPHGKLFPRLAAVVHHGGAGTTHAALRAGVPQIVVPHLLDQFYWAHRVWQEGLGPKPFWKPRLTAKRLTASLRDVVSQPSYKARSLELQARLIPNGVERAVREIERIVGQTATPRLKAAV